MGKKSDKKRSDIIATIISAAITGASESFMKSMPESVRESNGLVGDQESILDGMAEEWAKKLAAMQEFPDYACGADREAMKRCIIEVNEITSDMVTHNRVMHGMERNEAKRMGVEAMAKVGLRLVSIAAKMTEANEELTAKYEEFKAANVAAATPETNSAPAE